jgi:hypothetical protein
LLLQDEKILRQTEIILILNFKDKKKINLSEIFKDFAPEEKKIVKKIKIIKEIYTKKFLNMRDNWEFSIKFITGRWTLFLCDDDALIPSALKILYKFISKKKYDVICFDLNCIEYDHTNNILKYNPKQIHEFSEREFDSSNYINKVVNLLDIISFGLKRDLPYFPKVLCSTEIIKKNKPFFISHDAMTSSFFSLLNGTKKFLKINKSLLVVGDDSESLSSVFMRNRQLWNTHLSNNLSQFTNVYLKDLKNFEHSRFSISYFFNLVHVASKKFNYKILNINKHISYFLIGICKEAIRRNNLVFRDNAFDYKREIYKIYYYCFKKYNIFIFLFFIFKIETYRFLETCKRFKKLFLREKIINMRFNNIYEAVKYLKKPLLK